MRSPRPLARTLAQAVFGRSRPFPLPPGIPRWLRGRAALVALALAAVASCRDAGGPLGAARQGPGVAPAAPAPVLSAARNPIDGSYIVVLRPGADPRSVAAVAGVDPRLVYTAALNGFAARLNPGQLTALRHNPGVAYVEQDQRVRLSAVQTGATWGLDRIDQRYLPLDQTYIHTPTGQGVRAYVVDTGIRTSHADFGGRASVGWDGIGDGSDDCNGHGTHVAGTIGSATLGVAKAVTLVGVRVFGCGDTTPVSTIIAGVDWVTASAVKPAVANLSLGAAASASLDSAVTSLVGSGVTVVAAAGNDNQDACNVSPARVAGAVTVAATGRTDARWSLDAAVGSNHGSCVDLFAPGAEITSTWISSSTSTGTLSGTSMAAPHVAGVAALYLQHAPSASPGSVAAVLTTRATLGRVTDAGAGSPNRLLHLLLPPSGCGRLLPGEALERDQTVASCGGNARLTLQTDQNVVLYDPAGAAWSAAGTAGRGTARLHMQPDGNLVAYDENVQPLWSSGTPGNPDAWLQVQDDCNLVIYRGPFPQGGAVLWASNTACRAPAPAAGRMLPGERLSRTVSVASPSGSATLVVQADQNVVLYGAQGALWWAPNTVNRGTRELVMQQDGNLVAYDGNGVALWHSNTSHPGAYLAIQDDCNLVIYRGPYPQGNGAIWATGTSCPPPATATVAPVSGPFRVTKLENRECYNAALPTWTFCQHQGPSHTGTGVAGADDRYAWDVNLAGNADVGRPVYAAAPGRIVRYGGRDAPGGNSGAVLIEHNTNGRIWWSGYLHLAGIAVSLGQNVTTQSVVGYVGRAGAANDHLHFAIYTGANTVGGLRSYDAQFVARP